MSVYKFTEISGVKKIDFICKAILWKSVFSLQILGALYVCQIPNSILNGKHSCLLQLYYQIGLVFPGVMAQGEQTLAKYRWFSSHVDVPLSQEGWLLPRVNQNWGGRGRFGLLDLGDQEPPDKKFKR